MASPGLFGEAEDCRRVILTRQGQVLGRGTILKLDHYSSSVQKDVVSTNDLLAPQVILIVFLLSMLKYRSSVILQNAILHILDSNFVWCTQFQASAGHRPSQGILPYLLIREIRIYGAAQPTVFGIKTVLNLIRRGNLCHIWLTLQPTRTIT